MSTSSSALSVERRQGLYVRLLLGARSVQSFIDTAQVLENTGVMAYDGAIRYVDAGDNLQAGAQIATVEARHGAYLNLINGDSPFPNAFDMGKLPSQITAAVVATG